MDRCRHGRAPPAILLAQQSLQWAFGERDQGINGETDAAEIMARHWFETLLEFDGLEVPAWSRQEMAEAIKNEPLGLRQDRGLFGRLLKEWGIPDRARTPWQQPAAQR